jgi:hypothetical protein
MWKGVIPQLPKRIVGRDADNDFVLAEFCSAGEWAKDMAEQYYDGPDPIGKTHVREGVVVRILNRPKFCAYKHKNWSFKALSGIAVAQITENEINDVSDDILSEM